ncbi:MAG: tRNA adenosine(34) deaminase TadA [Candidatus Dormibacteria bacterium]
MTPDERWMRMALRLARAAGRRGEVPVGAVAVAADQRVASASNRMEATPDATAHAEMLALRAAARRLGRWRLEDVTLYVTLEPCPMCAGAMVLARLGRLVYAAPDPRRGAVESAYQVLEHPANLHRVAVTAGVEEAGASSLLSAFFESLRDRQARPGR